MVVISPRSIPRASLSTLATGARQLVVQLAFETTTCSAVSLSWLTPYTTVRSTPFAGAEISTRLAPAARCFDALSRSAKNPVHSKDRTSVVHGKSVYVRVGLVGRSKI